MKNIFILTLSVILGFTLWGCGAKQKNILETGQSQVKLRSMQSRVFDTSDRERILMTIIATMQDLAFLIDDADMALGTVSGTRSSEYFMRMTVSVRPRGNDQTIVRANAQHNLETVEDPEPYQAFFSALSKSLFLEAHLVDDESAAGGGSGSSKMTMTPIPKKTAPPKAAPKSAAAPQPIPTAKPISPAPKAPDVTSVPLKEPVVRVSLRKQPASFSDDLQILDILLEYDFYESKKNAYGAFVNSFIDNNDGTVTDRATGLMWQKGGSSKSLDNKGAKKYVKQLNKQRFAGYRDWRMPTAEELASILNRRNKDGVHIDSVFDYKQIRCWTVDQISRYSNRYLSAWIIDFQNGEVSQAFWHRVKVVPYYGTYVKNPENYVKAVRSVK